MSIVVKQRQDLHFITPEVLETYQDLVSLGNTVHVQLKDGRVIILEPGEDDHTQEPPQIELPDSGQPEEEEEGEDLEPEEEKPSENDEQEGEEGDDGELKDKKGYSGKAWRIWIKNKIRAQSGHVKNPMSREEVKDWFRQPRTHEPLKRLKRFSAILPTLTTKQQQKRYGRVVYDFEKPQSAKQEREAEKPQNILTQNYNDAVRQADRDGNEQMQRYIALIRSEEENATTTPPTIPLTELPYLAKVYRGDKNRDKSGFYNITANMYGSLLTYMVYIKCYPAFLTHVLDEDEANIDETDFTDGDELVKYMIEPYDKGEPAQCFVDAINKHFNRVFPNEYEPRESIAIHIGKGKQCKLQKGRWAYEPGAQDEILAFLVDEKNAFVEDREEAYSFAYYCIEDWLNHIFPEWKTEDERTFVNARQEVLFSHMFDKYVVPAATYCFTTGFRYHGIEGRADRLHLLSVDALKKMQTYMKKHPVEKRL